MSGHRDDGTFAEDKAHHPNRKVSRSYSPDHYIIGGKKILRSEYEEGGDYPPMSNYELESGLAPNCETCGATINEECSPWCG